MAGKNGKRPHRKQSAKKKSGEKSGGELVTQPHGGAIRNGSAPGNTPGTGRPPNEIRATARLLFDERLPILAKIADNEDKKDSDRIAAIDKLGGYGLDETVRVVTVGSPEFQERFNRMAALFVERLDSEALAIVKAITDEVWQ